jgi:hypothetical protein
LGTKNPPIIQKIIIREKTFMNTKKISAGLVSACVVLVAPLFVAQALSLSGGRGNIESFGSERGIGGERGSGAENRAIGVAKGDDRNENRGEMPFQASVEAISACSGKSQDDICSFAATMPGNEKSLAIDGTCQKARKSETDSTETLLCLPTKKDGSGKDQRREWVGSDLSSLQRAEQLKERKGREIAQIEIRIGKLIDFLKTKSVDTTVLESEFATLRTKGQIVLDKTDVYVTMIKGSDSAPDVATAREAVRTAGKDMLTYFHDTLREDIKRAVDGLND